MAGDRRCRGRSCEIQGDMMDFFRELTLVWLAIISRCFISMTCLFSCLRKILSEKIHMDSGCPCDFARMYSKKNRTMNTNEQKQMELGIGKAQGCGSAQRPQRRMSRANWWFQQMREVVDRAVDWRPMPAARAEQIYFPE